MVNVRMNFDEYVQHEFTNIQSSYCHDKCMHIYLIIGCVGGKKWMCDIVCNYERHLFSIKDLF